MKSIDLVILISLLLTTSFGKSTFAESSHLEVTAPALTDYVAGIYQWQHLKYTYNGEASINFSLKNEPAGMEITRGNMLKWTAPEHSEGATYEVKLITSTDTPSVPVSFKIKVATTETIHKEITGNTLILKDDECKFNTVNWGNFSITSNTQDIDKLHESIFRKIVSNTYFNIPKGIHRVSCFFRAKLNHQENSEDDYRITLPINIESLPKGYAVENIRLFTYEPSNFSDKYQASNVWQKKSIFVDLIKTNKSNYIEFEALSLPNRLYFIGYEDVVNLIIN